MAGRDWSAAYAQKAAADPAEAGELEQLAMAALWSGRYEEHVVLLERTKAAYEQSGDRVGAARMCLELARQCVNHSEDLAAVGWHGEATRLVRDEPECAVHGHIAAMAALALANAGLLDDAERECVRAVAIAQRTDDRDLQALIAAIAGGILVARGETIAGIAECERAAGMAMSGEVSLMNAGVIFCGTIATCRNLADWDRMSQWTEAADRWCEREGVAYFPGVCRVHRAEVLRLRGDLAGAETTALSAADDLVRAQPRSAGWAYQELGEVRLRRGNLEGADIAFRQALEYGQDPQPGLAMLRLLRGDPRSGLRAVERLLAEVSVETRTFLPHLLPALVTLAIASGELESAGTAATRLATLADDLGTPAVTASALRARGEVALAHGDFGESVRLLRLAWRAWSEIDAPYEATRTRVLMGIALRADGDESAALLEFDSARVIFERLGALRDVEESNALVNLHGSDLDERVNRTFVFTDIVDSTRLVDAMGDTAWSGTMRWHDRTLRAEFTRHHGEEVKHEGDGFFVAFADAGEAIACAIAIQRALATHRNEHGFAPEVRIGIHGGTATLRDRDYAGREVHFASRVGAAGGAGEIVVSGETAREVGAVGEVRTLAFKGFLDPVEVVTISWQ